MPKVSVIVPNYNHAAYLKQRLESIFNQTFQDFEVILLDDYSTDTSAEILNNYLNHPKVSQVVYNEVNTKSPAKQWIKGLTLAKGEWVWIAESDDYADVSFLETLVKLSKTDNKDIGLVVCNSHLVDIDGEIYGATDSINDMSAQCGNKDFHIFENHMFYEKYLGSVNHLYNGSSILFKRSKLKQPDKIKDFVISGDWMYWSAIVANSEHVAYTNQKLNYFRRIPGSVTYSNQTTARLESVKILFEQHSLGLNPSLWKAASHAANWISKLHPYKGTAAGFGDIQLVFQSSITLFEKALLLWASFLLQFKIRLK